MTSISKTTGSITTEHDDFLVEENLFTYSEEERQQQQINAANASHIFSPKFIPVYPQLLKSGLTLTEALIFGFIDFYKSSSNTRFYFTNEQIASIAGCSPDTVSRCISSLEKKGLIKTSKKMRAGGGLIRFVTDVFYDSKLTNYQFGNRQNLQTNKNKINNNKINKNSLSMQDDELQVIAERYEVPLSFVKSKYDDLVNYCERTGKTYKDYKAALRNFVKQDALKVRKAVSTHDKPRIAAIGEDGQIYYPAPMAGEVPHQTN